MWPLRALADLASTRLGKMLSSKAKSGSRQRRYLRNRDVQWGRFDLTSLPTMNFTEHESQTFALLPGDLLICEGGEVGRAAIWQHENSEISFQKALHRVRCGGELLPDFLFYVLRHYSNTKAFQRFITGSTIDHLPQEDLRRLLIPAPPLSEQRRIVESIEEQFSRLDAADALSRHAITRCTQLEIVAYSALLDSQWPRVRLREIAQTSSGGTPSRRDGTNYGGEIAWVKSGELGDSLVCKTAERITKRGFDSSSAKMLSRGTLLVAMYGATIGKLGVLDLDAAATNQAVCAIEPSDASLTPYLWHVLRGMRRDLIRAAQGGAQPNISQRIIRELLIPMPPLAERTRLIEKCVRIKNLAEAVKGSIGKACRRSAVIRQAILTTTLSGSLHSTDATPVALYTGSKRF